VKIIPIFLSALFFCGTAKAGIGQTDAREYVTDWTEYPYNLIGRLVTVGTCTAQYVGPDLILTAKHCINPAKDIIILETSRGTTEVRLIQSGANIRDKDWALYKIDDHNFHMAGGWFNISPNSRASTHLRAAGFGSLRVLTDDEIDIILDSMIGILGSDTGQQQYASTSTLSPSNAQFIRELQSELARRGVVPIFGDHRRLKSSGICMTSGAADNDMLLNSCNIWSGNSGGAIWIDAPGIPTIVGIVSASAYSVGMRSAISGQAIRAENFFRAISEYLGARQ